MSRELVLVPDRPRWLDEEPEVRGLLGVVLDCFDRRSGEERRKAIVRGAEKYLPGLARQDEAADQLWRFVQDLERAQVLTIRPGRRSPYDPDWVGSELAFSANSEAVLRDWLSRPRVDPMLAAWREAVLARAGDFPGSLALLLPRPLQIPGRSDAEILSALARAAQVKVPVTLRQLSAWLFWGDSKRLDGREEWVAALFPSLKLKSRALLLDVHLPASPVGVLFIENQDSYVEALAGYPDQVSNLALVYSTGFKGAAARSRERGATRLHYSGHSVFEGRAVFEAWWFDAAEAPGPLWFWGDLDEAGMQILAALRQPFDNVGAWPSGYAPMLAELSRNGGHSLDQAGKAGQKAVATVGCNYADNKLVPALRAHGALDQEWLFPGRPPGDHGL